MERTLKRNTAGENAANYDNPEFDSLFDPHERHGQRPRAAGRHRPDDDHPAQDAPWLFGFIPKGFSLQHAWVSNVKPNLMANNTLKYRRIDPALREKSQCRMEPPGYCGRSLLCWPLSFCALVWPALARSREQEDAR